MEETIRQGRNRSVTAKLVKDDENVDELQGTYTILKRNNSFGNSSTIVQHRVVIFVKYCEAVCKLSL